jgi:hypothetical protein
MAKENIPRFSRESIKAKQDAQKEQMEKNRNELRKTIKNVADTESGKQFLRFLFFLCGGDVPTVLRDKDQKIDVNETFTTFGSRLIWETIRFNMDSDTIKQIERHKWEDLIGGR